MSNVLSQTFWKDNIIALNRKRWHKTASILRCISDIVLHRAVDCVRSMKADPWQHNGRKITLNNVAKIWQRIIRGVTVHYNVVLPVLQLMAIKRWRDWFNLFQSSIPRTDPRHSAQTMCVHFRLPEYFQVLSGGVHFNPSLRIKMRYVCLQKERLNSGIVICRENGTVWLPKSNSFWRTNYKGTAFILIPYAFRINCTTGDPLGQANFLLMTELCRLVNMTDPGRATSEANFYKRCKWHRSCI